MLLRIACAGLAGSSLLCIALLTSCAPIPPDDVPPDQGALLQSETPAADPSGFISSKASTLKQAPPYDSGQLSPFGTGAAHLFVIDQPPLATSAVTFRVQARADLDATNEAIEIRLNQSSIATIFGPGGGQCATPPDDTTFTIPAQQFNALLANQGGDAEIQIIPTAAVSATECATATYPTYVRIWVSYCGGEDCDNNGVSDNCQISGGMAPDTNGNGVIDACELQILSITPQLGLAAGGTTVTIAGRGFGNGVAVLFGEQAATSITVMTPELLTAVTPPGGLGPVDITVSAVIDGAGLSAVKVRAFEYVPVQIDPGLDSDKDGLTDLQEITGYETWVDSFGLGFGVDKFGNVTRRFCFSDPSKVDTDDDGLTDYEEYLIRCDASMVDTDGDGLTDYAEWVEQWTSPVTVDSDADARGPAGTEPPNAALFDGQEQIKAFDASGKIVYGGTSPIYDDTDGDGLTDFEEWGHPLRSQLIADIPRIQVDFVGSINFQLDVALEDGTIVTDSEGYTLSESTGSVQSNSNESTWENSLTFTESISVGIENEFSATGGVTLSAEIGFEASQGFTEGGSSSFTTESSEAVEKAYSSVLEQAKSQTTTISGGAISTGIQILNKGPVGFTLKNLVVTALIVDDQARDGFKPLATFEAPFADGELTLAAGGETGVLEFGTEKGDVNANTLFELMANPTSLLLDIATFDLVNDSGLSYAFLNDVTSARTATLILDFGIDREIERYRVATEVRRNGDGTPAGITMKEVLDEILRIPYETKPRKNSTDPNFPNGVELLVRVRDRELTFDPNGVDPNTPAAFWVVFGNHAAAEDYSVNFQDVVLRAGQTISLVYTEDRDFDGVLKREEFMYSTSDENVDSDADGLTDFEEIREGWDLILPNTPIRRVYPSPLRSNIDGDLLDDPNERALGTNPRNPDTDGDLLRDGDDNCPLDENNVPPDIEVVASADPSGSEVELSGVVFESLDMGSERCDADAILEVRIDWGDGNINDPNDDTVIPIPLKAKSVDVNVSHVYGTLVDGEITLTATDVRGKSADATFPVKVTFPLDGLVAHYPFNNSPAGVVNAADATINNNDGSVQNSTYVVSTSSRFGVANRAICLTQSQVIDQAGSTAGVSLPHLPVPNESGEFTVTAWVQRDQNQGLIVGEPNFCALFVNDSNRLAFTVRDPNLPAEPNSSYFTVTDPSPLPAGANADDIQACGAAGTPGGWVFVAATVRFEAGVTKLKLYRASYDAFGTPAVQLVAEADGPAKKLVDALPNIGWKIVGVHNLFGPVPASDSTGSNPLQARVDDIRVYEKALVLVELNALFNEPENAPAP